jgi:hypothetical protein
MVPVPNMDDVLVSLISKTLQSHADAMAIFESFLAAPGDPWLATARSRVISSGSDLCFVAAEPTPSAIEAALSESRTTPEWIGALVTCTPSVRELLRHQSARIEIASIPDAIDDVLLIMAGAYDGEGVVLWEPATSS